MAEFNEIVDIFHKAHDEYASKDCNYCPMRGTNISQCRKLLIDHPSYYSAKLLDWKNNQPKPINWIEWLYKMGIFEDRIVCGNKHTCSLTEKAYNENVPEGIVLLSKELI